LWSPEMMLDNRCPAKREGESSLSCRRSTKVNNRPFMFPVEGNWQSRIPEPVQKRTSLACMGPNEVGVTVAPERSSSSAPRSAA